MSGVPTKLQKALHRRTLSTEGNIKLSTDPNSLSWSDREDIHRKSKIYIQKMKEKQVTEHAENVVYYRDLETTFGIFGTLRQQEEFQDSALIHGRTCHHCGETGHWKKTCTLTCNNKRCRRDNGRCFRAWQRGEQTKKFGKKHQGKTYMEIACNDFPYFQWVMRQWQPALDIYDLQEWGKDRNILYKKRHELFATLEHPQLKVPKTPIRIENYLPTSMSSIRRQKYEEEFNTILVQYIVELNKKIDETEKNNSVDIGNGNSTGISPGSSSEELVVSALVKEDQEEDGNSCDTECESPLFCSETL